ncbi:hypothetical protein GCM10008959_31700 [Deinococcus seoulensis]|uniref:Uncharacterized protein n=1 Tax=Deinococcus seoulensis TaxID=1837379 RepID=A0ABQ2RYI4_9DEIO|nr:hypothetical protein [Deinococcus seoulensis]GGR67183.1 hypothetical protein GCM10008959_31700 [Deinococcus seoulensis]
MKRLVSHLPPWLREAVRWQLNRHAADRLTVAELALLLGLPAAKVAPHAPDGHLLRADVLALLEPPRVAPVEGTRRGASGPCAAC